MTVLVTAREWLEAHGYDDVVATIDEIMAGWKASGSSERRDWWRVCAGGKNGKPRTIAGRTLPVIRAFQVRFKLPVTSSAIWKSEDEVAPPIVKQARWASKPKKRLARKTLSSRKR